MTVSIFTIGYGNRSIEEVLDLLQKNKIRYLVDVRSRPFSRFNPDFSRKALEERIKQAGIGYVYMGDLLGGSPQKLTCYTSGKVDYSKVEKEWFYQKGIQRLRTAWEKGIRVCLMCSELRPEECHRSKLIGQTLAKMGIPVYHIDESGCLRTQQEVIDRITGGQMSLFEPVFMSRKQYVLE